MSAESLREFKNFSTNLKKTSLGIKFGKKLFTNPSSFTPKQIVEILRALGMNVPREAVIAADLAQALIAGQALYNSYRGAKSASEMTEPTSASVAAGIVLLSDLGWISDEDGNIARTVQLGSDVAALVGSCGTDWKAWASLAASAYITDMQNKMKSQQIATKNLIVAVDSYFTKEQKMWAGNFAELQDGKIGVLGWITKNAMLAPALFYQNIRGNPDLIQKLPFLENVDSLPVYEQTFTATSKVSDTFLGMGEFFSESDTERYSFKRLQSFKDENQAREWIFKALIEPQLISFAYANSYFSKQNKISVENLFVLFALGSPLQFIQPGQDLSKEFLNQMISPYEMNEMFLQNFLTGDISPAQKFTETLISGDKTTFKKKSEDTFLKYRNLVADADKHGDVDKLFIFPETKDVLKRYSTFDLIPDRYEMALDRGGREFQVKEKYMGWRKIQNFASAMQYIEMVRKDPYYFKWESESLKRYNFIKDIDFVSGKVSYLSKLSIIRKINKMAKGNIEFYVGSKAKLKNPGTVGPSIFEE